MNLFKKFFQVSSDITFSLLIGSCALIAAYIILYIIQLLPINSNVQAGLLWVLLLFLAFCIMRSIEIFNEPKQHQKEVKRCFKVINGGKSCK